MKKLRGIKLLGIVIGVVALYLSVKNMDKVALASAWASANLVWFIPVILCNFIVLAIKAVRWRVMTPPAKDIGSFAFFRALVIGYMANNVLPARIGEVVRIHMLGKDALISRVTTTASVISDRIIEGVGLLVLAMCLSSFSTVPVWMERGLIITLMVVFGLLIAALIYSKKGLKNEWLIKFQDGLKGIANLNTSARGFFLSIVSWLVQCLMIYMTQIAFGVHLPLVSVLLVIVAVNIAIAVPSAPANLGTFELACILAYSSLGVDKNLGLLIGAMYHILQVLPVIITGGMLLIFQSYRPPVRLVDVT
ncbi:MAG: hypothetical protein A3I09_03295 [Deltaproteobacteria bacterium RIFCSPLOWO2_02_FULL_47_10]|nr:MAG: hypothetical protein A3I09_03295 [Deltaproteobacteria bacterium RIFCSPLOWO2_02_FULL_47_10]